MSNGQKWLLASICIGIMVIPFAQIILPTSTTLKKKLGETQPPKTASASNVSPASSIFIIPKGGVLVDKNTTGRKVVFYNVGDKIVIDVMSGIIPEALYFQNVKEKSVRIRKRRTVLTVVNLLKNHVRFKNFGTDTTKVKVTIISRYS